MIRVLICVGLMGCACLLAGVYGIVHNQISYSVAPSYFHNLKFAQFQIPPQWHNRIGAGLVGWHASWWMGLGLGPMIYLAGRKIRRHGVFVTANLRTAVFIAVITLAIGVLVLGAAMIWVDKNMIPATLNTRGSADPLAFFHAALMHEASYFGAAVATLFGILKIRRM